MTDKRVDETSTAEISRLIKTLKPKTTAGFDLVSNLMIKKLPPSYIDCLAKCFNIWLSECRYPDEWKLVKIVTLNKRKSGVPKCDETRPIALLGTHSKLFEKVLLQRIRYWAESNHLVLVEQSGFREKSLLPTRVLSIYQEVNGTIWQPIYRRLPSMLTIRKHMIVFGMLPSYLNYGDLICHLSY